MPHSDQLTIHAISFNAPCGVFPEEREHGMDYKVEATLFLDILPAAVSDSLADAVDYGTVAQTVVAVATERERFLVERLAEDIAAAILTGFPVTAVELSVTKVDPPVESVEGGVTITIRRRRAAK